MAQSIPPDIERLRNLAQDHLIEIQESQISEELQHEKSALEVACYAKSKANAKISSAPAHRELENRMDAESESEGYPKVKLRPVQDIISRLRWDPSINVDEYFVRYLDRFDGLREMALVSWVDEKTEEEFIPIHRIKQVVKHGTEEIAAEVVWDRDARLDLIFLSGQSAGSMKTKEAL